MFFASDNWAGAHPQIADALKAHAGGFDVAYGAGALDHRVEARFAEISAMRDYRQCQEEGLTLDRQARTDRSGARYLAAARMLEGCEARVGPEGAHLARDERMRSYALSVQDYFKGGNVAKARANLLTFKKSFSGSDLYYADGSSFVETMEILLGLRDRMAVGEFSVANVSGELKAELRRARYWTRN